MIELEKLMILKEKEYILEIPRPVYDRLANAFEWDDVWFISFDPEADTVTFKMSEEQRIRYAKYASEVENRDIPKKFRATYLITQMFLPKNIKQYEVKA
jgi:hypothetical protein